MDRLKEHQALQVPDRPDTLASDRGVEEFSAEDLKEARTEAVDAIIEKPQGWRGLTLFGVLQEYLNTDAPVADARLGEIAGRFRKLLNGDPTDNGVPQADRLDLARADAQTWLRGVVEDYLDEDKVRERATEIAAERLELAC